MRILKTHLYRRILAESTNTMLNTRYQETVVVTADNYFDESCTNIYGRLVECVYVIGVFTVTKFISYAI